MLLVENARREFVLPPPVALCFRAAPRESSIHGVVFESSLTSETASSTSISSKRRFTMSRRSIRSALQAVVAMVGTLGVTTLFLASPASASPTSVTVHAVPLAIATTGGPQPNASNTIMFSHPGAYPLQHGDKYVQYSNGHVVPLSATKCGGNVCQYVNGNSVCLNYIEVYTANGANVPYGDWIAEWLNGQFWDQANYGPSTPLTMPVYSNGNQYGEIWYYPGYYINGDQFQGGIEGIVTPPAQIIYRGSCTPS